MDADLQDGGALASSRRAIRPWNEVRRAATGQLRGVKELGNAILFAGLRLVAFVGGAGSLLWLYDFDEEAQQWLGEHRDITTIGIIVYVVLEVIWYGLSREADKTDQIAERLNREHDNGRDPS
jgi:hypothetical protein